MGAHFATVHGVFVAHSLFDEGVAGFAFDGFAAGGFYQVLGVPGEAGVVDDFTSAGFSEELVRQQADDVVAFDEAAGFVEEEAAVVVAVPGDTHGGAVFDDGICRGGAIFRQDGVGYAVGEVSVRLVVHFDKFERQVLFQFINHQAGAAVAGVADDGHGLEGAGVDVAQQVVCVGGHHFQGFVPALLRRIKERFAHAVPDVVQAVIGADGPGLGADHFHAVVVFRVVAGGDHDAAVHAVVAGGKVHLFGATQADVVNVGTGRHQAGAERLGDFRAGQADVIADDHFLCTGNFHIGPADFFCQGRVQLVRNPAPEVIGFEAGQIHCR